MSQQKQQNEGTSLVVQGRLVWGGLAQVQKKNFTTKKPEFNEKGEPIMVTEFGLAIPKPNPQSTPAQIKNFQDVWTAIFAEAGKEGFQHGRQDFAWKFDDGDAAKKDGTAFPEHYKGCIVIACSTRIPVKLFAWSQQGAIEPATLNDIKIGDYAQVSINIKSHAAPNAGLYINPAMVCRFAFGEAIIPMADPMTVFTQRPDMPMGASNIPVAPQFPGQMQAPAAPAFQMNQFPPFQMTQQAAPQMPNMGQMQAPQMQQQYAPNPAVLPPVMQQQMGVPQMGNSAGFAAPNTTPGAGHAQQPQGYPSNPQQGTQHFIPQMPAMPGYSAG